MAKVQINKPIVDQIVESLKDATSLVLLDYRGLTVEQDSALRRTMREAGCKYAVYKNTYLGFAVYDTVYECITPYLEGPTALAVAYEDSEPIDRLVYDFIARCPKLEVKCAVINGTFYEGMNLLKKVRNDITKNSLIRELLSCLNYPLNSLHYILTQVLEQKCIESGIDYNELTRPVLPVAVTPKVPTESVDVVEECEAGPEEDITSISDVPISEEADTTPTKEEPKLAPEVDASTPNEPPKEIIEYLSKESKYQSILAEARSTEILPNVNVTQEHNSHPSWDEPKKQSIWSKIFWILLIVVVLGLMYLAAIYEIRTGF